MRPTVRALRQAIGVESHYEIVAAGDRRDPGSSGERTPFAQQFNVLGDVQFLELTTVFGEPILGRLAVRSGGRGVDSDLLHGPISRSGLVAIPNVSLGSNARNAQPASLASR